VGHPIHGGELVARARNYLKANNPAAYYQKYVAPNLDRPGMAGAAANVERQQLLKKLTNQAVNPGLDIRPSPGAAVVAVQDGVPIYGQVQAAPAPAPPPPPPAPAAPSVSEAAPPPAADVTTQYTKQISDLQAQITELEKAREQTTLDWETRSKQMEETLATQQAEYAKTLEALKIRSQEELASLTEASNLQIGGLEASLGGLRTELGTAGQTIESLQAQMLGQSQEFEKSLAQQLEQYNLLSVSQKAEYESSIAQQLEKYQSLSEAQKQEYTTGLAAQQEQYQSLSASQKAEYQAGLANLTANQRAFQINQARAGQGAELQIQPATPATPQPAGTSMFKRRPRVVPMQISSQANLNVPTANVLNI
jgi:hypothetical protein